MNSKSLYEKYKNIIPYALFGVLTTLVNVAVYWLMAHSAGLGVMPSTIIAWIVAVLFAYITNRKWVFHSEAHTTILIIKEIVSFFICRLLTGVVDWVCMFIFVDIIHMNDIMIKFIANIVVIVLNYIASRMLIFKHKKET